MSDLSYLIPRKNEMGDSYFPSARSAIEMRGESFPQIVIDIQKMIDLFNGLETIVGKRCKNLDEKHLFIEPINDGKMFSAIFEIEMAGYTHDQEMEFIRFMDQWVASPRRNLLDCSWSYTECLRCATKQIIIFKVFWTGDY